MHDRMCDPRRVLGSSRRAYFGLAGASPPAITAENIFMNFIIPYKTSLAVLVALSLSCETGHSQPHPLFTLGRPLTIGGEDQFSEVGEITVMANHDILVSDAYQYTIKKFSASGKLLGKYGRRGGGDGFFESIPYFVRSGPDIVAVAEAGSPRLQLFHNDFSFIRSLRAPGPIVDFIIGRRGNIFVNDLPLSQSKDDALLLYNETGQLQSHLSLPDSETALALRMLMLENDRSGGCVTAYRYLNRIVRYDSAGNITAQFRIPGLPEKTILNRSHYDEMGLLPEGVIFHDIAVGAHGTIFLLGGDYSTHPEQDLYVVSRDGSYITTMTLPERSGVIYIDSENNLYTRGQSRTVVRKFPLAGYATR
jgi:hypothetical protein